MRRADVCMGAPCRHNEKCIKKLLQKNLQQLFIIFGFGYASGAAAGAVAGLRLRIRWRGQASAHLPQLTHLL